MRASVVQLNSQDDVAHNLTRVRELVGRAASEGSRLIALPENFAFMGEEAKKRELAEKVDRAALQRDMGPIVGTVADLAAKLGVWIVGGGMPERSDDAARPFNTSILVDPRGTIVAAYRKVHLFDVSLPDGTSLRESAATTAGGDALTAEVLGVRIGLSVCYDVRFPELYRRLVDQGARVIMVPSAFTLATGKDHWHVLLRARAIENQVFVLAPGQHGRHPKGRQTYGKSLIVDPWGEVLAQCSEGEGVASAELDFAYQDRVRTALPSLLHRKW